MVDRCVSEHGCELTVPIAPFSPRSSQLPSWVPCRHKLRTSYLCMISHSRRISCSSDDFVLVHVDFSNTLAGNNVNTFLEPECPSYQSTEVSHKLLFQRAAFANYTGLKVPNTLYKKETVCWNCSASPWRKKSFSLLSFPQLLLLVSTRVLYVSHPSTLPCFSSNHLYQIEVCSKDTVRSHIIVLYGHIWFPLVLSYLYT